MPLEEYIWGQVTIGDLAYQAELRSLGQHFGQYVGALCQAKCRSDFGDTGTGLEGGCNFVMPAPVSATVSGVTTRAMFAVSVAGSYPDGTRGSLSGGYFQEGTVKFTSGANDGLSMEITISTSAETSPLDTISIVTAQPFPNDIAVSDTVELQIGCDKTLEVCIRNYDNVLNFRGEPYVPGTDQVFKINS